ncbi:MAG: M23 family metallopeptidase [Cyanobacteria bacterium P01_G01_bin.49]
MKFSPNKLVLSSLFLLSSVFFNNIVIASGDTDPNIKALPNSPDRYLPSTPQQTGYKWPTFGVVTSGFGKRFKQMHTGVDIAGPIGTPIFAAASGVVVSAGWSPQGLGNLVTIRHGDGTLSLYGHNERILVRQGQQIEQGEQISEMGSTGNSTGPHLHFEIHPQGRSPVNPRAFLPTQQPPLTLSEMRTAR